VTVLDPAGLTRDEFTVYVCGAVATPNPVCVKGTIRSRFGCSGAWPGAG
jgi:hypothetical protein